MQFFQGYGLIVCLLIQYLTLNIGSYSFIRQICNYEIYRDNEYAHKVHLTDFLLTHECNFGMYMNI